MSRRRAATSTRRRILARVISIAIVLAIAGLYYLIESQETNRQAAAPPSTAEGAYALHFTTPSYPDDPARHRGGLDDRLVELIDRAQSSIDVAVYDFDLDNVASAFARASARGVRVRVVTDSDTLGDTKNGEIQRAFNRLRAAEIPIVEDRRPAIMHHKYVVVDGEWLATGSWNFTDGDTYRLNNWMGVFHAPELARAYAADFAEMFAGRFGTAKSARPARAEASIGNARVQACFSPDGKCGDLIAQAVRERATSSIRFLAFSLTHDGIGQAITDRASAGVKVSGVFETTGSQTTFSEFGRMKKAGLDVYTDGNPYTMHHKVIVLDGRTVIAGSFIFSANAASDNDENVLVIESPEMAKAFVAEFDRVLDQAKNPPSRKGS